MTRRAGSALAVLGVLVVLVGMTAGCDWSRPVFQVDSYGGAGDANWGDGVCATSYTNECTLVAAVEEANQTRVDTDILVPDGDYDSIIGISGKIRINWGHPGNVRIYRLSVGVDGQLLIDGLSTFTTGTVGVEGRLVARNSSLSAFDLGLRVGPTGTVALENTAVAVAFGRPAIINEGQLFLRHVSVSTVGADGIFPLVGPALVTQGTGTTTMWSTMVALNAERGIPPGVVACGGNAPVSRGYNAASDLSCGLDEDGDQEGAPIVFAYDATDAFLTTAPLAGSPLIDAVPVGVNGCGTEVVDDARRAPRPVDGDDDGSAACDIGASEVP